MSGSARHAARILRQVQHPQGPSSFLAHYHHHHLQRAQFRQFSFTRATSNSNSSNSNTPGTVEKPPTTVQTPSIAVDSTAPLSDISENAKSIEQLLEELHRSGKATLDPSLQPPSSSTASPDHEPPSEPGSDSGSASESDSTQAPPPPPPHPQAGRRSRIWFYLYTILYWSALGSIPAHILLIKGETKDVKEKQEWKIGVLTDMRDKLKRGESVEEEEALLSVGLDRSKREEQLDDKYFEDLLTSAEKMDFFFGKDLINQEEHTVHPDSATPMPTATTPVPATPPAIPRKPAPPKSEKSYL
ncbi:hypothetical protein BGZ99_008661 [Dissophora globulifera]|uniref:Uncharacterized protein n=1 Tax=Dissophora globulifera TaxID=979702 RepID=A0A9P6R6F3_9FUNG|nr:hypothetical protein BGZ99_008661 [Dissophora globulifera]